MTAALQKTRDATPLPRPAYELDFLPAALEIIERPPSPLGRAVSATIILTFCGALAWATIGRVDIVATAQGRIVPSGRTKLVQPLETGVISAIHVREGQLVRAGDLLIELDPTATRAEYEHLRADLLGTELEIARLQAILFARTSPAHETEAGFKAPSAATPEQIATQKDLLRTQLLEHRAVLAEIDRQLAQKQAERSTLNEGVAKLEATVPILEERVALRKLLFDKALGSKLTYLSEYQDLVSMKHDVVVQRSRLAETEAAIALLGESRERAEAEFAKQIFTDLTKAEERQAELAQDVTKAERRAALQRLVAPVDGFVQQLAVHTIGGVVTPAQTLAIVVPRTNAIEIEAVLSNDDIGFVHEGQLAKIKVETFNFTRYGLVDGRVLSISRDALDDMESRTRAGEAADRSHRTPGYMARLSLARSSMLIDGHWEDLAPGMAVSVEIRTGSRRIISYLLSPLERQSQEAFRER